MEARLIKHLLELSINYLVQIVKFAVNNTSSKAMVCSDIVGQLTGILQIQVGRSFLHSVPLSISEAACTVSGFCSLCPFWRVHLASMFFTLFLIRPMNSVGQCLPQWFHQWLRTFRPKPRCNVKKFKNTFSPVSTSETFSSKHQQHYITLKKYLFAPPLCSLFLGRL